MRILVYNWRDLKHPLAGGAEVYTDAVAREWVKMGHSVTLFCATVDGEPGYEMSQNGYQIVRKGSRHSVYKEAKRFWKREGMGNFDLVIDEVNTRPFFCHKFVEDAAVLVLIHQVAREVWFYESSFPMSWVGRFLLEPMWLWRLRDAHIVTVSPSSKRSLECYGLRNVMIIPEGYEPKDRPSVEKETDLTLVFLGRLSANKRPMDAIKAFEMVRNAVPNAKMWVIGDGPQRRRLEALATNRVELLGRIDEAEKYRRLASAHLLLVTSVREGWGMVVTEAASMGTPSIGYDVDGLRDSVLEHNGMIVKSDVKSLADAITRIHNGKTILLPQNKAGTPNLLRWAEVAKRLLERAETMTRSSLVEPEIFPDVPNANTN